MTKNRAYLSLTAFLRSQRIPASQRLLPNDIYGLIEGSILNRQKKQTVTGCFW